MKQSTELAWDITDWDKEADLKEANLLHNLQETFLKDGLIIPASIICRLDQELILRGWYKQLDPDGTNINKIYTPFGTFKLKVLPLERKQETYATYQKAVR